MANVTLKNVTKKFGDVVAVKNVELDIEDREFIVLVGPSGCGKSTTLRMIAGLEEITEGGIYIGDQFINHLAPKDRNIAMVFQSYALYPHMKVSDNMAFGLKMRKISKADREAKVEEIADILGIRDLLDRKPKELSGGQRQRVALGRAIVRDPEVFLFDEPLSNLDAKLRVQMRTELKKLHETLQTTAVYVTHDQVEAMTMGTRIVVMKDGLVQQVGSPLTLYNRPANRFVAGFIGSPAMNFLPCRVAEEGSRLFVDTGDFRVPLEESTINKPGSENGGEFLFGIRPEDFRARTHHEDPSPGNAVIRARVDVIEPLGKEIMLNINTGRHSLNVILPSDTEVKMHQELELGLAMEKSHLFQKESGKAVI